MRYLKDLHEGDMISENYLCKTKQTLQTKMGKNYYSLTLQDKTASFDGKVWDLNAGIEHFESMDYIRVEGQVVSFQGELQLNILRIRKLSEGEYDPMEYMPSTKKDISVMFKELLGFIGEVKDPYLHKLLESFFVEDKEFVKKFKMHSAAKNVHHGFLGGLLEHTVGVAKLCRYLAEEYPVLDRDLLITAAIFHDIGKVEELSTFPENDYTDEGSLLGHIYMGTEWIGEHAAKIPGFPVKRKHELQHCILAHHGELEYGSPKKPAIVEALALSMADNLDAKLETMTELFDSSEEKGWLGFQRLFDSNIRRTGK